MTHVEVCPAVACSWHVVHMVQLTVASVHVMCCHMTIKRQGSEQLVVLMSTEGHCVCFRKLPRKLGMPSSLPQQLAVSGPLKQLYALTTRLPQMPCCLAV